MHFLNKLNYKINYIYNLSYNLIMSYKTKSRKQTEEDFNIAFSKVELILKKTNIDNKIIKIEGGQDIPHTTDYINLEQKGGLYKEMILPSVIESAKMNNYTKKFYNDSTKTSIYMRGDIKNNILTVSLISYITDIKDVIVYNDTKQTVEIEQKKNFSIEIKDDVKTYSLNFDDYKFNENKQPGKMFNNNDNIKHFEFITKPFLLVNFTEAKMSNDSNNVSVNIGPSNMTEEIVNFLLHQLVKYKLAKNVLCIYNSELVTKNTVSISTTSMRTPTCITSYQDYNKIKIRNEEHENVFSQYFECIDKTDNKMKLVHAVTQLEPSDSSIDMKYCSAKNFKGLENLTKALAISNPNKIINDEPIFYIMLITCVDINKGVPTLAIMTNDLKKANLPELVIMPNDIKKANLPELVIMTNDIKKANNVVDKLLGKYFTETYFTDDYNISKIKPDIIGRFIVNKHNEIMTHLNNKKSPLFYGYTSIESNIPIFRYNEMNLSDNLKKIKHFITIKKENNIYKLNLASAYNNIEKIEFTPYTFSMYVITTVRTRDTYNNLTLAEALFE